MESLFSASMHDYNVVHRLRKAVESPLHQDTRFGKNQHVCNGRCAETVPVPTVTVDFIHLEEYRCLLEATVPVLPVNESGFWVECDGEEIPCETCSTESSNTVSGEEGSRQMAIRFSIPLSGGRKTHTFRVLQNHQTHQHILLCFFSKFSPLTLRHKHSYYCHAGWCIQYRDGSFSVSPVAFGTHFKKELLFLWDLFFGKKHQRKAALIRLLYWLVLPWKRKPLWLISDRRIRAGDNGEAFFRFLRANHPEVDARFILRKNAKAFPALKVLGPVLENDTLEEKLLTLMSDFILSSQGEDEYINPLIQYRDAFRDIMANRRFVFLQHGVTHHDLSCWLRKRSKNLYGFVVSAEPEYRSIIDNPAYGYTENEIWLTGFPRFDLLKFSQDPRLITIIPTWRKYLSSASDPHTMTWTLSSSFIKSDYFKFYSVLLSNERLLRAVEDHNYTLAFFPHPILQTHLDLFSFPSCVRVFGMDTEYRNVYEESSLLVTDYSSAVFDFAYMKKPVLYAQFDKEQFYSGKHTFEKGYFDYERDGFGEVEYDLDSTIDRIIEYMQNGCVMKPEYTKRVDQFFAYNDRNNCQRLYNRLMSP